MGTTSHGYYVTMGTWVLRHMGTTSYVCHVTIEYGHYVTVYYVTIEYGHLGTTSHGYFVTIKIYVCHVTNEFQELYN